MSLGSQSETHNPITTLQTITLLEHSGPGAEGGFLLSVNRQTSHACCPATEDLETYMPQEHQYKQTPGVVHGPNQFVIDGVCIINNNNDKKATVGEQKHRNSLRQRVELLLDQPLNLVLLAVVSGPEGLKSVKWLRSHPPRCKYNWAGC